MDLRFAFVISEHVTECSVPRLYWALDCLRHGFDDLAEGASKDERRQARQRIAMEFDRRELPLRHPEAKLAYPGVMPG